MRLLYDNASVNSCIFSDYLRRNSDYHCNTHKEINAYSIISVYCDI